MLSDLQRLPLLLTLRQPPGRDLNEIRDHQSRRLRRVVVRAYAEVPYYRELFDRNDVSPADIRGLEDLIRIPVTTRVQLQSRRAQDLVSARYSHDSLATYSTSGSSGRPLVLRRAWVEDRILATIRAREMSALGLRPNDRVAVVRTMVRRHTVSAKPTDRLLRWVSRSRRYPVDCMLQPDELGDELQRVRPDVVGGYSGQLSRAARLASREQLRALAVRFVFTGGEMLFAEQRAEIEEAFAAPVWDTYGSFEFDLIARECQAAGGYHVADDGLILEILRDGSPVEVGECGRVVATALHSHAMPLIRYDLGDVAERGPAPCPCGAQVSTLRAIVGRTIDMFTLPDGRVVHPYGLFIPIRIRFRWILHHYVHQLAVDHVRVQLVADSPPPQQELDNIARMLSEAMGAGVRVEVALVDEIDQSESGKLHAYSSAVPS